MRMRLPSGISKKPNGISPKTHNSVPARTVSNLPQPPSPVYTRVPNWCHSCKVINEVVSTQPIRETSTLLDFVIPFDLALTAPRKAHTIAAAVSSRSFAKIFCGSRSNEPDLSRKIAADCRGRCACSPDWGDPVCETLNQARLRYLVSTQERQES
jgi:hypothetical protein